MTASDFMTAYVEDCVLRMHLRGDPGCNPQRHGDHAHRVDVRDLAALEEDLPWAQPKRAVYRDVGEEHAVPGEPKDRDDAEDVQWHLDDLAFDDHEGKQGVEHRPEGAAREHVGDAGAEVRPGQRPRVDVRDVDLKLREQHEDHDDGEHGVVRKAA